MYSFGGYAITLWLHHCSFGHWLHVATNPLRVALDDSVRLHILGCRALRRQAEPQRRHTEGFRVEPKRANESELKTDATVNALSTLLSHCLALAGLEASSFLNFVQTITTRQHQSVEG